MVFVWLVMFVLVRRPTSTLLSSWNQLCPTWETRASCCSSGGCLPQQISLPDIICISLWCSQAAWLTFMNPLLFLLFRFLSIPKGFSYLNERGYVSKQLDKWQKVLSGIWHTAKWIHICGQNSNIFRISSSSFVITITLPNWKKTLPPLTSGFCMMGMMRKKWDVSLLSNFHHQLQK